MAKVELSGQQLRLWRRMARAVDEFRSGREDFSTLVSRLEADFEVGEFRGKALREQWFDLWGELEALYAIALDQHRSVSYPEAANRVEALRSFLMESLDGDLADLTPRIDIDY